MPCRLRAAAQSCVECARTGRAADTGSVKSCADPRGGHCAGGRPQRADTAPGPRLHQYIASLAS